MKEARGMFENLKGRWKGQAQAAVAEEQPEAVGEGLQSKERAKLNSDYLNWWKGQSQDQEKAKVKVLQERHMEQSIRDGAPASDYHKVFEKAQGNKKFELMFRPAGYTPYEFALISGLQINGESPLVAMHKRYLEDQNNPDSPCMMPVKLPISTKVKSVRMLPPDEFVIHNKGKFLPHKATGNVDYGLQIDKETLDYFYDLYSKGEYKLEKLEELLDIAILQEQQKKLPSIEAAVIAGIKAKISKDEYENMEKERADAKTRVDELEGKVEGLKDKIKRLKDDIAQLEGKGELDDEQDMVLGSWRVELTLIPDQLEEIEVDLQAAKARELESVKAAEAAKKQSDSDKVLSGRENENKEAAHTRIDINSTWQHIKDQIAKGGDISPLELEILKYLQNQYEDYEGVSNPYVIDGQHICFWAIKNRCTVNGQHIVHYLNENNIKVDGQNAYEWLEDAYELEDLEREECLLEGEVLPYQYLAAHPEVIINGEPGIIWLVKENKIIDNKFALEYYLDYESKAGKNAAAFKINEESILKYLIDNNIPISHESAAIWAQRKFAITGDERYKIAGKEPMEYAILKGMDVGGEDEIDAVNLFKEALAKEIMFNGTNIALKMQTKYEEGSKELYTIEKDKSPIVAMILYDNVKLNPGSVYEVLEQKLSTDNFNKWRAKNTLGELVEDIGSMKIGGALAVEHVKEVLAKKITARTQKANDPSSLLTPENLIQLKEDLSKLEQQKKDTLHQLKQKHEIAYKSEYAVVTENTAATLVPIFKTIEEKEEALEGFDDVMDAVEDEKERLTLEVEKLKREKSESGLAQNRQSLRNQSKMATEAIGIIQNDILKELKSNLAIFTREHAAIAKQIAVLENAKAMTQQLEARGRLQEELDKLQNKNKGVTGILKKSANKLETSERIKMLKSVIEAADAQIELLRGSHDVGAADEQMVLKGGNLEDLKRKNKILQSKIDDINKQVQAIESPEDLEEISEKQTKYRISARKLKSFFKRPDSSQFESEKLQVLREQLKAKEKDLDGISKQEDIVLAAETEVDNKIKGLNTEIEGLEAQLLAAPANEKRLREEIADLRGDVAAIYELSESVLMNKKEKFRKEEEALDDPRTEVNREIADIRKKIAIGNDHRKMVLSQLDSEIMTMIEPLGGMTDPIKYMINLAIDQEEHARLGGKPEAYTQEVAVDETGYLRFIQSLDQDKAEAMKASVNKDRQKYLQFGGDPAEYKYFIPKPIAPTKIDGVDPRLYAFVYKHITLDEFCKFISIESKLPNIDQNQFKNNITPLFMSLSPAKAKEYQEMFLDTLGKLDKPYKDRIKGDEEGEKYSIGEEIKQVTKQYEAASNENKAALKMQKDSLVAEQKSVVAYHGNFDALKTGVNEAVEAAQNAQKAAEAAAQKAAQKAQEPKKKSGFAGLLSSRRQPPEKKGQNQPQEPEGRSR